MVEQERSTIRWAASGVRRTALLLALLFGFAVLKGHFDPGLGRGSADGNYYYQIARHVSEGDGLVSSVSLYHQGFQRFPHRVNQNPLWPLVLGASGRWFGLDASAAALPELLYLVDLVLLYALGRRLGLRGAGPGTGWVFREGRSVDLGHVAVLLFGANAVFFRFTSLPYTEALSFGLGFAALLALDRAALGRSAAWAGLAGLLAGLALLTRTQMLAAALAIPAALALAGLRERRLLALAAVAAAAAAAALLPWVLYLSTWLEPMTPLAVIGAGHIRETPQLEPFEHFVAAPSAGAYLLDRARGLAVAFDPGHRESYVRSFGAAAYLVPLAALHWAARRLRAPRDPSPDAAQRVLPLAAVLLGAGMLVPAHLAHGAFFKEWLFAHRHGLPLLFLILPALAHLDRAAPAALRWLALALLVLALLSTGSALARLLGTRYPGGFESEAVPALAAWLDAQQPRPAVVTTKERSMALVSRAGFHYMHCDEELRDTLALLRHAGADYVLEFREDRRCRFLEGRESALRLVRSFGEGRHRISVYALAERRGTPRTRLIPPSPRRAAASPATAAAGPGSGGSARAPSARGAAPRA